MDWLYGLVGKMPWWNYVISLLILTHFTIMAVTLYLHRSKTHGSVEFNLIVEHFFRFWLWLTTGMKTHEWVAVHRKHHAKCETEEDPHSPKWYKIRDLFINAISIYREALKQDDIYSYVQGEFSKGLPNDWIEINLYSKYPWLGLAILGVLMTLIMGWPGFLIFLFQAYWIPGWAMGVINGFGHYWGYRNCATPDESCNIFPWGIIIGGEELHNNHHAYQTSPKLSLKWWEFDIGWLYILLLSYLGLAKVDLGKVAKIPVSDLSRHLDNDKWLSLFKANSYYIGEVFQRVLKQNSPKIKSEDLVSDFLEWCKEPNQTTAFVLGQWVDNVIHYEDGSLKDFAYWLRGLNYPL